MGAIENQLRIPVDQSIHHLSKNGLTAAVEYNLGLLIRAIKKRQPNYPSQYDVYDCFTNAVNSLNTITDKKPKERKFLANCQQKAMAAAMDLKKYDEAIKWANKEIPTRKYFLTLCVSTYNHLSGKTQK